MAELFATGNTHLAPCELDAVSFFGLVEQLCEGSHLSKEPLRRFCSLARKMGARGMLLEDLEKDGELGDELEAACRRTKRSVNMSAQRLSFFRTCPDSRCWADPSLSEADFLGYAVIVRLDVPDVEQPTYTYILEAVMRTPSATSGSRTLCASLPHYYIHNKREFRSSVGPRGSARHFKVVGSFFAQQNGLTHVCAHACLRMAINSSPVFAADGLLTNAEINRILTLDFSSPERIIGRFADDPQDTRRHSPGLSFDEIAEVAKRRGANPCAANFLTAAAIHYDEFVYPLIESGCPAILSFQGWDMERNSEVSHVVSVVGHTLNTDRWAPEARFGYGSFPRAKHMPVTDWIDHFIISDDNYGMYLTVPTEMLRNVLEPSHNPWLHAARACALVPQPVTLGGYTAEQIAVYVGKLVLDQTRSGANTWAMRMLDRPLVTRTLLVSGDEYRAHLQEVAGMEAWHKSELANIIMPQYVWVTELTLPQLYCANKRKLGEVVQNACLTPEADADPDKAKPIFAWLPGVCVLHSGVAHDDWPLQGHVEQIRSQSGPPSCEW